MPKHQKIPSAGADPQPVPTDHMEVIRPIIIKAYRFALEFDGAPARCRSRRCKNSGRCNFTMEGDKDGVCRAGIPGHVNLLGVLLASFYNRTMCGYDGPWWPSHLDGDPSADAIRREVARTVEEGVMAATRRYLPDGQA
jgi:hypothetical protein